MCVDILAGEIKIYIVPSDSQVNFCPCFGSQMWGMVVRLLAVTVRLWFQAYVLIAHVLLYFPRPRRSPDVRVRGGAREGGGGLLRRHPRRLCCG